MSKFTKERLVEYVKGCIEHAERFPGVEIADKEKAIFEIALSALTGPMGRDDRQPFESWYGATCGLSGSDLESEFNLDDAGEYIYSGAADAWKAWKASRAAMIQEPNGEPCLHTKDEEDPIAARRRRNRESNARARERETPTQRKARLTKNRARKAIRRKGGAK